MLMICVASISFTTLDMYARTFQNQLLRLCKTNFGEVFSAWIHIKAQRVFIDAVLRYGLPPDFRGMLIKVGRLDLGNGCISLYSCTFPLTTGQAKAGEGRGHEAQPALRPSWIIACQGHAEWQDQQQGRPTTRRDGARPKSGQELLSIRQF